jgi:thioester reductase-like protein
MSDRVSEPMEVPFGAGLDRRLEALSPARRELFLRRLGRSKQEAKEPGDTCMTVDQLSREAELDPDVQPLAGGAPSEPADEVLLTGATGFLGAFLVEELLARTSAKVVCLVRAPDQAAARRRLSENLLSYRIRCLDGAPGGRVEVVLGDIRRPRLGLAAGEWEALAARVGAVYHCAADVKWTFPFSALRATNVDGTHELLRFAAARVTKPMHFISTVGVFSSRERSGDVAFETDPLESSGPLYVGYAQTKWVAEKLVSTAAARGMPVTIHRPNIVGHSRTGAFNRRDHLCLMIKGCVELGAVPDLRLRVGGAPVDFVSGAIVELSRRPELWGRVFHLVSAADFWWSDLAGAIQRAGYAVERLAYAAWRERLLSADRLSGGLLAGGAGSALRGLSPLISDALLERCWMPRFDPSLTDAALTGCTLPPSTPNAATVERYFGAYVEGGFLRPPSL